MEYISECIVKFQSLPDKLREKLGGDEAYLKLKEIENRYQVSLSFLIILFAIGELEEKDCPEYLMLKFSISKERAQEITEALMNEIISPALIDELNLDNLTGTTAVTEKLAFDRSQVEDVFDNGLIPMTLQDAETIKAFNYSAFAEMDKDDLLEDRLINLLLNNEELISANNVVIDGRSYRGTVKSWLKDFINKQGSDIFDSFVLAKYINSLGGEVELSPSEKKLLTKILKTYRNLVFFPESMENTPMEKWAIIPFEEETVKQKVEELHQVVIAKKEQPKKDNFKPDQEDVNNIQIELQNMLSDYSLDSLEYKAIKEEINRLNKKK